MTTPDIAVIGIAINAVSALVMLVTVIITVIQAREMRRATYAAAFESVYNMLQDEDVQAARYTAYSLADKPFESWTDNEKKIVEQVCCSYDAVGIMIRNGMLPVEVVADSWGESLRRSWRILSPMVASYRAIRNSNEFWDDFEWLARQAESFQKTVHSGRS